MSLATPLPMLLLMLGLLVSSPTWGEAAICDLKFDGDDRVTIPNSASLNPSTQITVETRVNFGRIAFGDGYSGTDCQYMVAKGGERRDGFYGLSSGWGDPVSQTTTRLGFAVARWGGAGVSTYITPETDRWYHVAGTFDGNVVRLYLDGALLASNTVGSQVLGNTYPLYFGYMDTSGFPYYLTGMMDEVRIWDYARTTTQIGETMNVALSGNESGLVGLWNFDEELSSQAVLDSTPNGNNGYLGYTTSADYRDPDRILAPVSIPEPSTLILLLLGAAGLFACARRRRR